MKKFLSIMFAFAIIFTSSICLTACGDDKDKDKDGSPISLIIVNGDKQVDSWYYRGEVVKGTELGLNYKIYAHYGKGKKKLLSAEDYTTTYKYNNETIASLPENPDLGDYEIIITYKKDTSIEATIQFYVVNPRKEYEISLSKKEWREGDSTPTITFVGDNPQEDGRTFFYQYVGLNELSNPSNPSEMQLDFYGHNCGAQVPNDLEPGEYYIYVIIKANDDYSQSITNYIKITILPQ